mmetsp:Transcript_27464/g.45192  ORF Transcript_27464/g.45192 Transcript_27464/m.45192 type:complete len:211 (+) Transcript_27464:159-791(+)
MVNINGLCQSGFGFIIIELITHVVIITVVNRKFPCGSIALLVFFRSLLLILVVLIIFRVATSRNIISKRIGCIKLCGLVMLIAILIIVQRSALIVVRVALEMRRWSPQNHYGNKNRREQDLPETNLHKPKFLPLCKVQLFEHVIHFINGKRNRRNQRNHQHQRKRLVQLQFGRLATNLELLNRLVQTHKRPPPKYAIDNRHRRNENDTHP